MGPTALIREGGDGRRGGGDGNEQHGEPLERERHGEPASDDDLSIGRGGVTTMSMEKGGNGRHSFVSHELVRECVNGGIGG
jgi:hypothetical protein